MVCLTGQESRGIGFSYVVSLGDMADVDVGDLLDFLAADVSTGAILLYLETIPAARKFMSASPVRGPRQACGGDQVRTERSLRQGRGDAYRRACGKRRVGGHAAFRRAGLVRVEDLEDLFHGG